MFPDLDRLRVLYQVMGCGSVSAAARELHVTQSAVSQSIKKLEAEIDAPLFERRSRRLVPTAAAHSLYTLVSPLLTSLPEHIENLRRAHHEPVGCVRLGAPVEFGLHLLPALLASFRQRFPDVRFALELGHPTVTLPQLEAGQLDLAFADIFATRQRRELAPFSVEKVMDEELVMVGSARYHRRTLGKGTDFERLAAAEYIAYRPRAPALHGWFRHHFGRTPQRLRAALTVESVRGVLEGVRHHIGFGLVPAHLIVADVRRGRLRVVKAGRGRKELTNRVSLVRLLDHKPSRSERLFVQHIKRCLPAMLPLPIEGS